MYMINKARRILVLLSMACLFFLFATNVVLAQESQEVRKHEVIFLLDSSNSMNTMDPNGLALDSLEMMICALPSNYSAGFIAYNDGLQIVQGLISEKRVLKEAVSKSRYTGYTNAGAGLEKALLLFSKNADSLKSIVIISDGEIMMDNDLATKESLDKFKQSKQAAEAQGIRIYTMAIGDRRNAPAEFSYGDNSQLKLYEISSPEKLSEAAKQVLFEDFGIQRSSVSSGEIQNGGIRIKIPVEHISYIDHAKVLITSDHSMENIAASYTAQNGEISTGKKYALVDITHPQTNEIELRMGSSTGNNIRADLILEIKAAMKVETTYPDTQKVVDIQLTPVGTEDESRNFLDDPYFEGKSVRVMADGEELLAKVNKGKINFTLSAENTRRAEIKVHFEDLGVNVIAPESSFIQVNRPEGYGKYLMMLLFTIIAIGLFIWYKCRRPKLPALPPLAVSRYDYAGKLQIYISKSPDDSDIAPQVYNLSRRFTKEEMNLESILEQCDIKLTFQGSQKIWFSPGANKALVITNKSDCTILKNRDLLIKDHSCLLYFDERLHITFEDESSELILYYKAIKPGDK